MFEQIKESGDLKWECKTCHRLIPGEDTVAYHMVDKILYGWCHDCFIRRHETERSAPQF